MGKKLIRSKTRRQFIVDASKSACAVGFLGFGLAMYSKKSESLNTQILRPPGALGEKDFQSACIRCGLCVEACPHDMLKLGRLFGSVATGTPYFIARTDPCEMCEDIPCKLACPTGALDPKLDNIDDARMGLAVLLDQENCLNFQGLRCEVCYRVCPLIDKAITLETRRNTRTGMHAMFIPTVHSDVCTGCGKCEESCVLPVAAIKVLPLSVAKGKLGEFYRWGWKEKEKAGKSLIDPVLDLPDRVPDSLK
ncbi:MAG: ferredoxin-type protein NapG [Psychromonas sp.]|nr:ferredoxin-type protein NapG [Psychromonas sp.]